MYIIYIYLLLHKSEAADFSTASFFFVSCLLRTPSYTLCRVGGNCFSRPALFLQNYPWLVAALHSLNSVCNYILLQSNSRTASLDSFASCCHYLKFSSLSSYNIFQALYHTFFNFLFFLLFYNYLLCKYNFLALICISFINFCLCFK